MNSIIDTEEPLVYMDGYDDCIIGTVEQYGQPTIICYDKKKVIQKLMEDGCDEDEAIEFFEFNQLGAWWGEYTPCFLTIKED